ncbi:unnamed protein product [Sphenostylis stenocarpa]|uniref:Uncharacterized protein n=1 Tax=Sphenostylis stenocarpa TaxID=92480 RepID=A0AA86SZD5_9FABA|nr:unnamed protein product [Sphenostylis stenocarpa]
MIGAHASNISVTHDQKREIELRLSLLLEHCEGSPKCNVQTLIFCSQTLRNKVRREFEELPSTAFGPLRDSLNTLLKKFHKGPPKVRKPISIDVAALAVHVPAEDWGDGGTVKWLSNEMDFCPGYIPGVLGDAYSSTRGRSVLSSHPLVLTALSSLNSELVSEAAGNVISELIHYTALPL